MKFLGVRVDNLPKQEAIARIAHFLDGKGSFFITTPNPEIIMAAYQDREYANILNKADLALADGIGLKLAAYLTGQRWRERITGSDMVREIARLAAAKNLPLALLGGLDQTTTERAGEQLMKEMGCRVVFCRYGVSPDDWAKGEEHEIIVDGLRASNAVIVLVGFGHPKQERWIDAHRGALPHARLFMGIGGSLDFIAGARTRAPRLMRSLGLEWLWRLMQEPRRFRRIITAVIRFPLAVIHERFSKTG